MFCKLASSQFCTLHQFAFWFHSACRPAASQLHSPPAASQVSYTALMLQVKSVIQPSCCKSSQLHSPHAASQLYNPRAVIQAHSPPAASQSHNPRTASQLHSPLACKPAASQLLSPIHTLFRVVKQRIQMVLPLLRY